MIAHKPDSEFINRRATPRFDYGGSCVVLRANRQINAIVCNISAGGMAVQLQGLGRVDPGDIVHLRLGDFPAIRACVCWMSERKVGLRFDEPLDRHPDIRALLERLENGEPVALSDDGAEGTDIVNEQTVKMAVAEVAKSVARATDRSGK